MIKKIIIDIYTYIGRIHEINLKETNSILLYSYKILKRICVYLILLIINIEKLYSNKSITEKNSKILVSLTSYPIRISTVWMTITSIANQSIRPCRIILFLSKEEFPNSFNSLPKSLVKLLKRGLEIEFVNDNLKSHKKYFYSFSKYPDYKIITIDDDIYYPYYTIEKLLVLHEKFPKCICANVANYIEISDTQFLNYKNWKIRGKRNTQSNYLLAIGYGGILYPENFRPIELLQKNLMKNIAITVDDLWLKAIQTINYTNVAVGDYYPHPMVIPNSQKETLTYYNVSKDNGNDIQWQKINNKYDLIKYFINQENSNDNN